MREIRRDKARSEGIAVRLHAVECRGCCNFKNKHKIYFRAIESAESRAAKSKVGREGLQSVTESPCPAAACHAALMHKSTSIDQILIINR